MQKINALGEICFNFTLPNLAIDNCKIIYKKMSEDSIINHNIIYCLYRNMLVYRKMCDEKEKIVL